MSIKEVSLFQTQSALMFKINYSTAKTLIRQYRLNMFPHQLHLNQKEKVLIRQDKDQKGLVRCEYKEVETGNPKLEAMDTDEPYFYLQKQSEQKRETSEEVLNMIENQRKRIIKKEIEIKQKQQLELKNKKKKLL